MPGQTYYDILELSPEAPQHEVHQAYLRAKETYNPDSPALYSMFTKEEAYELLKLVEEAFSVLGDINRRAQYDQSLLPKANGGADQGSAASPGFSEGQRETPDMLRQFIPKAKSAKNEPLPEGHARTKVSTYKVNDTFEKQIKEHEAFTGEFIKSIREYKNIEIQQVCDDIRISKTYLNAIESDDYGKLPAPVFVRGFIVQLGKLYGVDGDQMAKSFMSQMKQG